MKFWASIGNAINEHKAVRRILITWAVILITIAALHPEWYSDAKFLGIVGLLTTVIAFYQWTRSKEDEK